MRECATGSGSGSTLASLAVLAALVLAAPVAIAGYARSTDSYSPRVALAIVTSILFALPLILMTAQVWWYVHDCMT